MAGRAAVRSDPDGDGLGRTPQVVTGLVLVGLHEMSSDPADELIRAKIGVKLVIAPACAASAEIANGRQRRALAATAPSVRPPRTARA